VAARARRFHHPSRSGAEAGDKVRVNVQLMILIPTRISGRKAMTVSLRTSCGLRAGRRANRGRLESDLSPANRMSGRGSDSEYGSPTIFFFELSMSFYRLRVVCPRMPTIALTPFTARRWSAIQIFAPAAAGARVCRHVATLVRLSVDGAGVYRRLSRSSIVLWPLLPIRRNPHFALVCFFIGVTGNTMRRWRV